MYIFKILFHLVFLRNNYKKIYVYISYFCHSYLQDNFLRNINLRNFNKKILVLYKYIV